MCESEPDFGACCACGSTDNVRNVMMLDQRGPVAGKGWGCIVCGLPSDGAIAVLCDACIEAGASPRMVVVGYAADGRRMPIAELDATPFTHDPIKHGAQG